MKLKPLLFSSVFFLILCLSACKRADHPDPKHPVTLTMWHNYGGDMQGTMDYLIDQFNSTVGKNQGIVINVTAISSSAELNESLTRIARGDPGAPEMPDLFTGYPKIAMQLQEKDMLVNLDQYVSQEELSAYVDAFIEEGRFADGGLYVFPLAKSTEILYLNKTLFDRFARDTGAKEEQLSSFEGISELARLYYDWTDGQTPDVPGDGRQFYAADSWLNVAEVGMEQLGGSLFDQSGKPLLEEERYAHIFETFYTPAVKGGVALYDGYSSDLSKTGDLVCSTGSSAGILFYGDTITWPDGRVETVEYRILPYPVFDGGRKTALLRGGGLMAAKSERKREYAAAVFLKWLTAPEQNLHFISKTGYLPVTKQAFEKDMERHMETLEDLRIKRMLQTVLSMYQEYELFTAPNFRGFDEAGAAYEADFKRLLLDQCQLGENAATALEALQMMREAQKRN